MGENVEAVENSPFLEKCKAKGVEVLYMVDPIDEYAIQHVTEFDGKKLQSVTKEGLKFGDEDEALEAKRTKLYKETFKPLTDYLKELYGDAVVKVSISKRVQAFSEKQSMGMMMSQKTMELNPRHPIINELLQKVKDEQTNEDTENLAWLLLDNALMQSGFQPADVDAFAKRALRIIQSGLALESSELLPEMEVPEDEEEEEDEEDEVDLDAFGDDSEEKDEL